MLLKEKLKQINFSPSESEVIRFLQANETTLADRTIQQIAATCYVHPSTLIRIAKKIDLNMFFRISIRNISIIAYCKSCVS